MYHYSTCILLLRITNTRGMQPHGEFARNAKIPVTQAMHNMNECSLSMSLYIVQQHVLPTWATVLCTSLLRNNVRGVSRELQWYHCCLAFNK